MILKNSLFIFGVAATMDKIGEGILVVHSQGGANGWPEKEKGLD